jgi:hypothetical protein
VGPFASAYFLIAAANSQTGPANSDFLAASISTLRRKGEKLDTGLEASMDAAYTYGEGVTSFFIDLGHLLKDFS